MQINIEPQTQTTNLQNPEFQLAIRRNRVLLLISNISQGEGRKDLDHAGDHLRELFGGRNQVLIFPHAAGNKNASAVRAEEALKRYGVVSTVRADHLGIEELIEVSKDAQGVMINGGNTWDGSLQFFTNRYAGRLQIDISDVIRQLAADGRPISGWSAGSMLMTEAIGPCEDPVVTRSSASGFIVPAQGLDILTKPNLSIFPHFTEANEQFVVDYMGVNPGKTVLALRNGSSVFVRGMAMDFVGEANGTIFLPSQESEVVTPGTNISSLIA